MQNDVIRSSAARAKSGALRFAAALFFLILCLGATARGQEYLIHAGDLLKITVFDNPELTTEAKVSAGGRIAFPLVGEVEVGDLTAAEAGAKIAALLQGRFIKNPQVTVSVGRQKVKVNVLGEFVRTGLIEVPDNATLVEVISLAGGLKPSAGDTLVYKRKILVQGETDPIEEKTEVQLGELLEGRSTVDNLTIANGDSVYVPRASFVFVSGAVKDPGFHKISSGLTVYRAITLSGGFTVRAAKSRVKIMRKTDVGEEEIKVRMEDLVQPDDIIVVPTSFF